MVVQAGEARFVVDCRVKPVKLVGHVKIKFPEAGVIVSCGGATGREMLNMVPFPVAPPALVVPKSKLADKTKPAMGLAPSLFVAGTEELSNGVKLCRAVKPVPSV